MDPTQASPDPTPKPESWPRRLHRWGAQNPKWYYITPASSWAVFIYVTCMMKLKPIEDMGLMPQFPGFDKLVHFTYYLVFAALVVRGAQREKMPPLGLHLIVFAMCVVFGTMIEMHQRLTGYRSFELMDIAADAAGAAAGLALWHLAMLRWGKRTALYPGLFRSGAGAREKISGRRLAPGEARPESAATGREP